MGTVEFIDTTDNAKPAIDTETLLARCMGRIQIMDSLLTVFQASAEQNIATLVRSISENDHAETARLAHKLKGTALTIAAHPLADTAERLCQLATSESTAELQAYGPQIEEEFARILSQLQNEDSGERS
ncbi:MAG: Hpt domain-containing protein [Planctomycetales bacterium]|nr:Hpt domain-containing protein [Planctomycetales bacterium]